LYYLKVQKTFTNRPHQTNKNTFLQL